MGDRGPEVKPEEQFPLLKVDGGGDNPPQTTLPPGWGVQCTRKCSWISRWPECMSTCWMTLVLLGISALVVYALSIGAYRHQQFVFMWCKGNSPANYVFYHEVVPRGAQIPFLRHSEYLANMATEYRRLQFNVFFLIDDSYSSRVSRSNRFLNKLIPYSYYSFNYKSNDTNLQAIAEFQRRYHNVNVRIMSLSKYMSTLRFKWKAIPTAFLPFYMRVFTVWENGGVGMELGYHLADDDTPTARRRSAILKQHNDGIVPEAYANALKKIDKEEDTALFTVLFGLVNRFLNETRSFLNRTLTISTLAAEPRPENRDLLIRTHRSKREVVSTNFSVEETTTPAADQVVNTTVENTVRNISSPLGLALSPVFLLSKAFESAANQSSKDSPINKTDTAVVLFYDYHFISADTMGPSYMVADGARAAPQAPAPAPAKVSESKDAKDAKRSAGAAHLLSLDPEGTFVAASSRLHPFLNHVVSTACLGMAPKFAIQDTLLTQCAFREMRAQAVRDDVYCNNIYIL